MCLGSSINCAIPSSCKRRGATYKFNLLRRDVMVNPVAGGVAAGVVTFARTFALGVAGVVADEAGAAHQQVKQEAKHFHANGDEEEDERVLPLVWDQQLGEDARQGDDDPGGACVKTKNERVQYVQTHERGSRLPVVQDSGQRNTWIFLVLTLSSHHPLRVPLGQHPHVTIETGLLHWKWMRKWFNS